MWHFGRYVSCAVFVFVVASYTFARSPKTMGTNSELKVSTSGLAFVNAAPTVGVAVSYLAYMNNESAVPFEKSLKNAGIAFSDELPEMKVEKNRLIIKGFDPVILLKPVGDKIEVTLGSKKWVHDPAVSLFTNLERLTDMMKSSASGGSALWKAMIESAHAQKKDAYSKLISERDRLTNLQRAAIGTMYFSSAIGLGSVVGCLPCLGGFVVAAGAYKAQSAIAQDISEIDMTLKVLRTANFYCKGTSLYLSYRNAEGNTKREYVSWDLVKAVLKDAPLDVHDKMKNEFHKTEAAVCKDKEELTKLNNRLGVAFNEIVESRKSDSKAMPTSD